MYALFSPVYHLKSSTSGGLGLAFCWRGGDCVILPPKSSGIMTRLGTITLPSARIRRRTPVQKYSVTGTSDARCIFDDTAHSFLIHLLVIDRPRIDDHGWSTVAVRLAARRGHANVVFEVLICHFSLHEVDEI